LSSQQLIRIKKESTTKKDIVEWVVEEAFVKDEYKPRANSTSSLKVQ
jgi:hypothetical protein